MNNYDFIWWQEPKVWGAIAATAGMLGGMFKVAGLVISMYKDKAKARENDWGKGDVMKKTNKPNKVKMIDHPLFDEIDHGLTRAKSISFIEDFKTAVGRVMLYEKYLSGKKYFMKLAQDIDNGVYKTKNEAKRACIACISGTVQDYIDTWNDYGIPTQLVDAFNEYHSKNVASVFGAIKREFVEHERLGRTIEEMVDLVFTDVCTAYSVVWSDIQIIINGANGSIPTGTEFRGYKYKGTNIKYTTSFIEDEDNYMGVKFKKGKEYKNYEEHINALKNSVKKKEDEEEEENEQK